VFFSTAVNFSFNATPNLIMLRHDTAWESVDKAIHSKGEWGKITEKEGKISV